MKRTLIYIAIGLILLIIAYFIGRRSAKSDVRIEQAEAKAKLYELKAKRFQDSAQLFRDYWLAAEAEIPKMDKEIDSLKKRRMVNVTHATYLPVVRYKKTQLDSIWMEALK